MLKKKFIDTQITGIGFVNKGNKMLKKNDKIEVYIIDYGADGEGIAKVDNFTIFINGAIKGEICKIIITKVLKNYGYGKIIEIIKKSEKRTNIDCKTYPRCGGCSLRHIEYKESLNIKKENIQNLINKNVDKNLKVNDCIGMENPFYYRNKAIYPVTCDKSHSDNIDLQDKNLLANYIKSASKNESQCNIKSASNEYAIRPGIYAKRSHTVIPFEECKIQTKTSQEIAKYICKNWKSTIYNEETLGAEEINKQNIENKKQLNKKENKNIHGILRNIMVREGFSTGQILVVIVEYKFVKDAIDINKLIRKFPNITTVVANINSKNTNVVLSNENIVLYGEGYIFDKIGDYTFKISPNSFYQVNPKQTKVIYETAIREANLNKSDILCDLYSGIGTIGIFASKYVSKVYGIEIVSQAIKDAKENAKINNIENIEFMEGDVETAFDKLLKNNINPNAVIVDPPRKGLDEKTIENLNNLRLEKLVYVSCNPATLARDLSILQSTYKIKSIIPIDNFPYSSHVETVVTLNKKESLK